MTQAQEIPESPGDPSSQPDTLGSVLGRLGPAAILGGVWTVLPALGGFALLAMVGPVSDWLNSHQEYGPFVYAAAFIIAAGIGLLPTYSQAVVGGWAFGPVIGTIAALAGFVGASLVGGAIARRVGRQRVENELARHPRWRAVRDQLLTSGGLRSLGIVTLVRLPPNSPFSLTNLVLSTTGVRLWKYALGTAAGMLPRTALVVWLAHEARLTLGAERLGEEQLDAVRPGWFFPVSIGVTLVIFFMLYHIGKRALDRVTGAPAAAE